jgi:hypothetical protein
LAGSLLVMLVYSTTLHLSFQLDRLNFLLGVQHLDGNLVDPMCNNSNKLSVFFYRVSLRILCSWRSLRNVNSSGSCFMGPKPMGFQAFFGLSRILSLVSSPPWNRTLSLTQTIESLRIGWTLKSPSCGWKLLKFKNGTPEKLQVQALSSSSSGKGARVCIALKSFRIPTLCFFRRWVHCTIQSCVVKEQGVKTEGK